MRRVLEVSDIDNLNPPFNAITKGKVRGPRSNCPPNGVQRVVLPRRFPQRGRYQRTQSASQCLWLPSLQSRLRRATIEDSLWQRFPETLVNSLRVRYVSHFSRAKDQFGPIRLLIGRFSHRRWITFRWQFASESPPPAELVGRPIRCRRDPYPSARRSAPVLFGGAAVGSSAVTSRSTSVDSVSGPDRVAFIRAVAPASGSPRSDRSIRGPRRSQAQ